jgi:hypothetical protein
MRHRQRHAHKTLLEHLREELTDLGWFADPACFGTTPITLVDYQPLEAGETPALNTVAVSFGDQLADLDHELGGGLTRRDYVVFIDIYGASEPIGVAIGDDIKDALTFGTIALLDYTTDPAGVPVDAQLEFNHVIVETIPTATSTLDKRSWRCVKATVSCYF